jgi:hypothetical protein
MVWGAAPGNYATGGHGPAGPLCVHWFLLSLLVAKRVFRRRTTRWQDLMFWRIIVGVLLVGVLVPVRGGVQSQGPVALQAELQPGMATPHDGPEVVGAEGAPDDAAAAIDVHAMAPDGLRVRHRSDNDTKAQTEIDEATKSLKAKPDNIFPEDDRGLVSRADDEDGVIEVISDGTQEGLEEGFAAEAAAVTAAAPRPVYSPLDDPSNDPNIPKDHTPLPGRQKGKDVLPEASGDVCTLSHPPGIGSETDSKGKPRWSRFYTLRDVCVSSRPRWCGTQLDTGFGMTRQGSQQFQPLDTTQKLLDVFPRNCTIKVPDNARHEASGLAFTVQHFRTFQSDSILNQASSALSLDWDAAYTVGMMSKLAKTSTVLLPQFSSREQLETDAPWLMGMLDVVLPKCVLPHMCPSGRQLRTCDNLTQPVCFDELLVHRQVGPWLRRMSSEGDLDRKFFPEMADARRFQRRAADVLELPKCPPVYKRLTITLAVRRDALGYSNWAEIIAKVTGLVSSREPWFLEVWEPKAESLAAQAKRLACTDLLVAGAGSHMTNMIFLPPRAGVIFTARCGCRQNSGFVRQTAEELGLRWWDVLEDCAEGQNSPITCAQGCQHSGTCASSDGDADVRSACSKWTRVFPQLAALGWDAWRRVWAALRAARGAPPAALTPGCMWLCRPPRPKVAHFAPFLPQVSADFEKNWKNPIGRALDDMRVWNNTRGGMWIRNQSLLA